MESTGKITVNHKILNGDQKPKAMKDLWESESFIVIANVNDECEITTNVPRSQALAWLDTVATAWGVNINQN